jgi:hypothetical protein
VKGVRLAAAERLCTEAAQGLRIAIVVVSAKSVAGLVAAAACQGAPQLLGLPHSGAGCDWARHMGLRTAELGVRAGVVRVRYRVEGSVAAVSDLAEARTGAAPHLEEEGDSAVAGAQEEKLEEVDRTGRLAEARSIAVVGLGVHVLSRVRLEGCSRSEEGHSGVGVPYPTFSGGAVASQSCSCGFLLRDSRG